MKTKAEKDKENKKGEIKGKRYCRIVETEKNKALTLGGPSKD